MKIHKWSRRIPYMCTTNSTTNEKMFTLSDDYFWLLFVFLLVCFAYFLCIICIIELYTTVSSCFFIWLAERHSRNSWYLKTHLTLCIPDRLSEGSLNFFLGHHYVRTIFMSDWLNRSLKLFVLNTDSFTKQSNCVASRRVTFEVTQF